MKYIALLRGINVGGNNKIAMSELKTVFEKAGFLNVSTYINSGNVIFSSDETDKVALQNKCQDAIFNAFNLDIAVCVITADELTFALNNAPKWWDTDEKVKHNAIFVIAPADGKEIADSVGEVKPEYEKCAYCGQVIFWSAPLETFSHTRWSKVAKTAAYKFITIRNANTAKKLAKLCVE